MNIEKLHKECLLETLTDSEFRTALQQLNQTFTTDRNSISSYGNDVKLVSAYAAYYMPTNMKKLDFVLSQLDRFPIDVSNHKCSTHQGINPFGTPSFEVIDLGCGPGTYGFGVYEYLNLEFGNYIFVDSSQLMLKQAKKIQQLLYPEMSATFQGTPPAPKEGMPRLVVLGNVLNEIGFDSFTALHRRMRAESYLFVEPGTQQAFKEMSAARTYLMENGYQIAYPCPGLGECPAAVEGSEEWCHQVLKTSLAPAVARLGQLAGLDRTVMPFIGQVYTMFPRRQQGAVLFRLRSHSKHAFFWEVCMNTDNGLRLQKVELPKRGYSKKEQKSLAQICAGQRISFEVTKNLGNGVWRISTPQFAPITGKPGNIS